MFNLKPLMLSDAQGRASESVLPGMEFESDFLRALDWVASAPVWFRQPSFRADEALIARVCDRARAACVELDAIVSAGFTVKLREGTVTQRMLFDMARRAARCRDLFADPSKVFAEGLEIGALLRIGRNLDGASRAAVVKDFSVWAWRELNWAHTRRERELRLLVQLAAASSDLLEFLGAATGSERLGIERATIQLDGQAYRCIDFLAELTKPVAGLELCAAA